MSTDVETSASAAATGNLPEEARRFFANPYDAYQHLRTKAVIWDADFGFWRITRYEDVDAILRDKRFAKNPPPGVPDLRPIQQVDRFSSGILNLDPPDHTRIRSLMVKAFNAKRMEAMRPVIESLVANIIEAHRADRTMELKGDFAHPIPATIISDMLGIPEDQREHFAQLSQDIIRFGNDLLAADDEAADEAIREFDDFLSALVREKRANPTDDLTSALIEARDDGGALSEKELIHNVRLLFIAGHETTVNLICNAVLALFQNREQLAYLREHPDKMSDAVEEFLRFDSSVQQLPRVAQEDVEMHGETIKAGQMIVLMLGSANHDDRRYEDSEKLNVDRTFHRAKSFGGGAHFCLGAQLARLETEIAVRKLITELPGLCITNMDSLSYPPNPFFRGPEAVQLAWD
ncbi:MAG: cytochrome P450 [Pseudomonadales bacterium]|nr:cytochrome P450 [Pseudomonadales bacterium]